MVTDKRSEMEKLIELVAEDFTAADMKNKIPEAGIFDYSERAIKIYLDHLVDTKNLISQHAKIARQNHPIIYSKDISKIPNIVRKNTCRTRNEIIYKDLCDKYCQYINCEAYVKLFKI